MDLPFFSIVSGTLDVDPQVPEVHLGIFQPLGLGTYFTFYYGISVGIMFKVKDNWTPPDPEFVSISPNQGEQGETLYVTIDCINTTFLTHGPPEITFSPPDGIDIIGGKMVGEFFIGFDMRISSDAPIGFRDVIVTYDDGNKAII